MPNLPLKPNILHHRSNLRPPLPEQRTSKRGASLVACRGLIHQPRPHGQPTQQKQKEMQSADRSYDNKQRNQLAHLLLFLRSHTRAYICSQQSARASLLCAEPDDELNGRLTSGNWKLWLLAPEQARGNPLPPRRGARLGVVVVCGDVAMGAVLYTEQRNSWC